MIYMCTHVYTYILCIYYRHTLKNSTKISKSNFDNGSSFSKVSALQSAVLLKKGHCHGIQWNIFRKLFSRTTPAKQFVNKKDYEKIHSEITHCRPIETS